MSVKKKDVPKELWELLVIGRKIADIKPTDKDYLEVRGGMNNRKLLINKLGVKTFEYLPKLTKLFLKNKVK